MPFDPPRRLPRPLRRAGTTLLALGLVGVLPTPGGLAAQSAGREPAVLELPRGARATGLGAPQLAVADPDLFRTHPALAGRGGGMRLSMIRLGPAATAFSLATTTNWYGGSISIGLGLESLEYRGGTPGTRPGGLDPLFGSGDIGFSETAAVLAASSRFAGFDVGASVRLTSMRVDASRRSITTADVGVSRSVGPVRSALTVRGLGRDFTIAGADVETPLEIVFGSGIYGWQLGPLDVGAAAEVGRRGDGEFLGGGGLEIAWWPVVGRTFTARVGARNVPEGDASPLSVGASFQGDALVLEWGWRPVDGTDGLHTVTIGWR